MKTTGHALFKPSTIKEAGSSFPVSLSSEDSGKDEPNSIEILSVFLLQYVPFLICDLTDWECEMKVNPASLKTAAVFPPPPYEHPRS